MTAVTATAGRLASECSPPPRAGSTPRSARGYASGKTTTWPGCARSSARSVRPTAHDRQRHVVPRWVIQVASATRGLQEVAAGLLNDHLAYCVTSAVRSSEAEGEAALAEVAGTIRQVIWL